MKSKTEKILMVLRVLAWVALIGYIVSFASQLISFIVSLANPEGSKQIPGVEQDLTGLKDYSTRYYIYSLSFVLVLSAMYCNLWYQVITLLSKLNIRNPFTIEVSRKLESLAYSLVSIWAIGFIGENYIEWISKRMGQHLDIVQVDNQFLFTAGIVYIISQIFKHGIEIQEENLQTI